MSPTRTTLSAAALAAALCAAAATSACGHSTRGTLRVAITYAGGPPGAPASLRAGTITALRHGHPVAHAKTTSGSRASLKLAPGSYTLQVSSGQANCPHKTITIKRATASSTRISCSVK